MHGMARILIPVAVIILLSMAGIIDLSLLPWNDGDFQATLATVVIYLIWSVLSGSETPDASRVTLYAVLLVSVLDSFLLRLTAFSSPAILRWAGVLVMAAGCAFRTAPLYRPGTSRSVYGRIAQMAGLALGLGSIAGAVIALFPGVPSAMKEKQE